jgi:DNA-3-methyladenine glycosylase
VALLLVWPLPLAECERVETWTILPLTCTDVRRIDSSPGACSRPLDFAAVTLPRAGAPERASVLPLTTRLRARVASNLSPTLAVPELISDPTRTVIGVPAGMVCATATRASNRSTEAILSDRPSMRSSVRTNPWQYYAGGIGIAKKINLPALAPLPRDFYARDPRLVSRDLLGKVLVRRVRGGRLAGRIVEVEAYLGADDPAAHSASGRTLRNAVLFGPPGHSYVYFIYGNYFCFNVSCLPDGEAGGVLFRALEPLAGIEEMAEARGLLPMNRERQVGDLRKLTSGPGRLAEAFGITRLRDNEKDLTSRRSDLFIADEGFRPRRIEVTPRIGITKAVAHPLRYIITGNEFVSK